MSDIGWGGLAISGVLVLVAIVVSWRRDLGLERSIAWAAIRAAAQLAAVGFLLRFVLEADRSIGWSWIWVVVMVVVAALTVRSRAREVPGVFTLALIAFAVSSAIVLGVLFGLHVFTLSGRTLIPLAGLMIGNSMGAAVLVSRRVYEELRDRRADVEARLALGQSAGEAAKPFVRAALRTALVPQIETTKAVGLVVLPGAMTGLIIAGVPPLQAVQVQAAVMYVVLGATATTTTVVALGVQRRLYTRDHRLVRMVRPGDRTA